mgnify:CR=1 FL=1
MIPEARRIVETLDLKPHPEGGWFRETSRDTQVDVEGRAHSTAIYYLLEAGDTHLPAQAGLLETAEWRHLIGDETGIDADDAAFERLRDTEHAGEVARVEISGETEFGIVRLGDHVRLVAEGDDRGERGECLFVGELHVLGDVGDDGRLEEGAAEFVARAAGDEPRTAIERVLEMLLHLRDGRRVDQRTLGDAVLGAPSHLESLSRFRELFGEGVCQAFMDIDSIGADAGLAGIAELRDHCTGHGRIEIGILENDEGRIAAEFE